MSRSLEILLEEILDSARRAQAYIVGLDLEKFTADVEKQDAVIRRLEIIGEAVKGLPATVREEYPDIPWRDIAGARDVLVHEYFPSRSRNGLGHGSGGLTVADQSG